ncbi:MAG: hypothetical protein FJ405_07925, partial [Verrucomicrobia bacterium]|nr:hypothetical protein [Verrucomicrobiota bacterium]
KEMGTHSDVYSLGAVLYHLLTGRPPFMGESIAAVLAQVESMAPVRPRNLNPGVPLDLETICLKCLEKSPDKRYPDARSFSDELKRFLGGNPFMREGRASWREPGNGVDGGPPSRPC